MTRRPRRRPDLPATAGLAQGGDGTGPAAGRAPCADNLAIVGSSLGGFYATWLAERLRLPRGAAQPGRRSPEESGKHVGVTTPGIRTSRSSSSSEYIDELAALKVARITRPERYFLIGRHRRRSAGLPRHGGPLRGRAPARDRGQRPCDFGIRAVCRRGAGILPTRSMSRAGPDRTAASEAGLAAPGAGIAHVDGSRQAPAAPCATG
jgi:hypothetical protein